MKYIGPVIIAVLVALSSLYLRTREEFPERPVEASESSSLSVAKALGFGVDDAHKPIVAEPKVEGLANSLKDWEVSFSSLSRSELEAQLVQSKQIVTEGNLIARSNEGSLSDRERDLLKIEIRKQGVLSAMLVKLRIARLHEKYL